MAGDPHFNRVSLLLPMTGSNGSTTFTDQSPSTKTMTASGNAQISTTLEAGGTGYFDGTGDYISTPFNTAYRIEGDFTVEAWCYFSIDTGTAQIISAFTAPAATAATSQWLFYYTKGTQKLGFDFRCFDDTYESHQATIDLALTTFHHLVGVRKDDNVLLFANGTLLATIAQTKTIANPTSTGPLTVGAANSISYLNGYVKGLRLTKGVARYTDDFTPESLPLPTYLEPRALELYAVNQPIVQAFNPTIFNG